YRANAILQAKEKMAALARHLEDVRAEEFGEALAVAPKLQDVNIVDIQRLRDMDHLVVELSRLETLARHNRDLETADLLFKRYLADDLSPYVKINAIDRYREILGELEDAYATPRRRHKTPKSKMSVEEMLFQSAKSCWVH
ncbi:MAG: hypothetical protein ABSE69_14475, partial [Roseiarcus sp.]